MSRIELDDMDRRAVERVRALLAETEHANAPADEAAYQEWKDNRVGKLQAAVDVLLTVIDGGQP